uniref:Uncharacterized protein n=1 Tax=Acrobeloides nanus TaxID=290746 RepID=A0A914C6G1_9BILA
MSTVDMLTANVVNMVNATTTIPYYRCADECVCTSALDVNCIYNETNMHILDNGSLNPSPTYIWSGLPIWSFVTLIVFVFITMAGTGVASIYHVMNQRFKGDLPKEENLQTARFNDTLQEDKTQVDDTVDNEFDIGTVSELKDRTLMASLRQGIRRMNSALKTIDWAPGSSSSSSKKNVHASTCLDIKSSKTDQNVWQYLSSKKTRNRNDPCASPNTSIDITEDTQQ